MIRAVLTVLCFVSAALFPWPLTALLALATSIFEPLLPLAVGIFVDTLYGSSLFALPRAMLLGACVTAIALFVRSRLRTTSNL